MPEWLIPIFVFYLIYLYSAMTKSKSTTEKPASKAKTEKPAATVAVEEKSVKPSSTQETTAKVKTATPKPAAKAKVAKSVEASDKKSTLAPKPSKTVKPEALDAKASKVEMPVPERVGLTAGSIWQYLAKNGNSAVAKLVKDIPEEEKIIQRSIGWLAQEGKISLSNVEGNETIGLNT